MLTTVETFYSNAKIPQARIFQSSLEIEAGMVFSKKKSAGFKIVQSPR